MNYAKRLEQEFGKKLVFSKSDAKKLFYKDKISNGYLDLLLCNLVKQDKLIRIRNGSYSFNRDIMVSGFAYSPFYYGLEEALSLRNLHEQETNPIIITVNKVKPGLKQVQGNNILLKRISCKYFFGFEFISYYGIDIPVSDYEKTLIDFAYYNEPLSEDAKDELLKRINKNKLNSYLSRYQEKTRQKVLSKIK